jgi:hypothetical protein
MPYAPEGPRTSSYHAQVWLFTFTRWRSLSESFAELPRLKTKGRLCHDANGSRVEDYEQQPIPHEHMELNACGDLANASVGPREAFGKMSDEWSGTIYLNGACVPVCAKATEAAHNPYAHTSAKLLLVGHLHPSRKLSAWPKDLQLDIVNDPDISTLDIQAWMLETKAPVVILRCIDGTDDRQFDQLVGELGHSCSVIRPRFLPSPSHTFTVRNCEVEEPRSDPGTTSPHAGWRTVALCCISR